jgi:hypothetical protein
MSCSSPVLFLRQPRLGLGGEAVALFQELLLGQVFQVRAEAEVRPRPGDQDRHRDPGLPGRVAHHAGDDAVVHRPRAQIDGARALDTAPGRIEQQVVVRTTPSEITKFAVTLS